MFITSPVSALALGTLLATTLFGQSEFHVNRPSSNPWISGAPYSGEESFETIQTLADGTHITRKPPSKKIYRGSDGRTRTEQEAYTPPARPGQKAQAPLVVVETADPAARVRYILDTRNRIAHRQELPASTNLHPPMRIPPNGMPPIPGVEQLGSQTMEGVRVEGTRRTYTTQVGAIGNDRPIINTHETWMSPDLLVTVLSKSSDFTGNRTQKLTGISRAEPDPTLFQVPPDYTVVVEKGEFTIIWDHPLP